jgi:steroid 5-alpha reductase family enzyme
MAHPLITLTVAFALMTALWPLSLKLTDVSIIDIMWAPAFAFVGWVCVLLAPGLGVRQILVIGLVTLWSARLGFHIYTRWRRLGHEDYRYAEIRRSRGARFPYTSLVLIFWGQALLLWIISWPLQAILDSRHPMQWNGLDALGLTLMAGGIAIEAVADVALTRFRSDRANRRAVLDRGIWAWSRHPNYFGDFLLWWGIYVVALASHGPWWTIFGPIAMSALLIHYSGKGLMEDTIGQRRPGYADYVRRTSGFIPWPPQPKR